MELLDSFLQTWGKSYVPIVVAFVVGILINSITKSSFSSIAEERKSIWWILVVLGAVIASLVTAAQGVKQALLGDISFDFSFGIISKAYAADAIQNQSTPIANWVVAGIFVVIFVTFIASVLVTFFCADIPENKSKLAAADNIMKTFGGFFIGVATSFANQNIAAG